jgi:hypothetical protein
MKLFRSLNDDDALLAEVLQRPATVGPG